MKENILGQHFTKDDVKLIYSMKRKYGRVSRSWLQYKFKLSWDEAERTRKKYDKRISES
jgi:hypothetical protein